MKHILIIAIFILTAMGINAQHSIKGVVQDSDKLGLIGSVVVVLNPLDSTMVGFASTDENGAFQIDGIQQGEYLLQITYIGHGTVQRKIEIKAEEAVHDLGVITLMEEGEYLKSVTISAEYIPIKVSKDTLEFNADAFKTQPNAVVEDLLKKLPGVEVDDQGGIKVKGEEVKKVTVDGKDFFGSDPKMATKNLPADAVKKVQVFEKKSKTSEFTGISDGGEEWTINLELREEKRNGYFGNIMAGYGTDKRYEGKAMLNKFSKNTQLSFLGGLNNVNNTGIDFGDYASMTGGGNMRMMRRGDSNLPLSFGQSNNGETASITTGVNFNQDLGLASRLTFSYFLTQGKTDLIQSNLTNSFLPTGTLISNNSYNSNSNNLNHNFNANVDIRIDSTTEMTFRGSLAINNGNADLRLQDTSFNENLVLVNRNDQLNQNNKSGDNYNLSLNVRKKLGKPGRTISLDGTLGASESESVNKLLSSVYGRDLLLNDTLSVFQDQNQNSDNSNYSYSINYTEPLSNTAFLIANASRRNNRSDLLKDFYDLNPDDPYTLGILNEELSRTYDNRFVYNTGGLNLRVVKENYSASLGVDFQNSTLDGQPSIGEYVNRTFNNFLPKANLELDKLKIRLYYSTSVREPSIDQLQPVLDNSDPLKPYQGNPDLVPEYRHNLRLSYNFFDQFNFRSLFANLRLGYNKNRITTAQFVDPVTFVRTQIPVNTEGETTASLGLFYSSPLNFMKSKFRAGINSSLTNGISFIDSRSNEINRLSNGFNLTLENKSKSKWDGSIGGRWSLNNNIYKSNEAQNSSFFNQTYNASVAWFAGKGWTLDTKFDYYIYDAGSFDAASSVKLWQASVAKAFLNNKLTTKLRVFDILNQNQGISRTASETQISESISNTIGRYVMLNVTYSLNALGNNNDRPHRFFM